MRIVQLATIEGSNKNEDQDHGELQRPGATHEFTQIQNHQNRPSRYHDPPRSNTIRLVEVVE
jgi:hypothetical protein